MFKVELDKKSLRQTQEALKKRQEKALRRKNIKQALRSGATVALDEARRLVPVDTGRLRDNLAIRVYGNSILIRSTLDYATDQEFNNRSYLRAAQKRKEQQIVEASRQEYKRIVI